MREIGRIGNNPKPCHMKKIHNVGNVESGREMELRGNVMDFFKLFKVSMKETLDLFCLEFCCCSVTQSCLTLCDPMDCSMPGIPVLHCLLEFAQTHVHWVNDTNQPSHPLLPASLPALQLFQHQGLFQWVSSSHQVPKVLEFQLQHQSCQWVFRVDSDSSQASKGLCKVHTLPAPGLWRQPVFTKTPVPTY